MRAKQAADLLPTAWACRKPVRGLDSSGEVTLLVNHETRRRNEEQLISNVNSPVWQVMGSSFGSGDYSDGRKPWSGPGQSKKET
jgi:hypothetical protein